MLPMRWGPPVEHPHLEAVGHTWAYLAQRRRAGALSTFSLPSSTTAASAGRRSAASAAPSAPRSRWWASSLKWGCVTAATRPSQMRSKSQQPAELSRLRDECDPSTAPSPAAMNNGTLVSGGFQYGPWQVGKALFSIRRWCPLVRQEERVQRWEIISVLLSIPGVCALKIDVLGGNPLPAHLLENCPGIQEPELHC